jgi:hypothetical protein
MGSLIMAVGLAAISCVVGEWLTHAQAMHIYALILAAMAGSYIGVAMSDGRGDRIAVEVTAAVLFGAAAYYGTGKWPLLLAIGFAAHAVWHLLHHPGNIGVRVRPGFAFAGIVYDSVLAAYIYLRILHH